MNEIMRFRFEGDEIPWRLVEGFDHGVGVALTDIYERLGYQSANELSRVVRRNKDRFKTTELKTVKLTGKSAKGRPGYVLSPRGFLKACIYGNTPRLIEFHDALVAFLDDVGSGEVVVLKNETYAKLVSDRDSYRDIASSALPIMRQHAATIEHFTRVHQVELEYASTLLRTEKSSPGAQIIRALKNDDARTLFDALTPPSEVKKPAPDDTRPIDERIIDTVTKAKPAFRRLKDVCKAVGGPARDTHRELKILFTIGRLAIDPDGSIAARVIPADIVPTGTTKAGL